MKKKYKIKKGAIIVLVFIIIIIIVLISFLISLFKTKEINKRNKRI